MVYALFLGDRITPVLHPAMSVIHSEQSTLANVAIQCPLLHLLRCSKILFNVLLKIPFAILKTTGEFSSDGKPTIPNTVLRVKSYLPFYIVVARNNPY
jgi:hypothetical protein